METQSFVDVETLQAALTRVFAEWVQELDLRELCGPAMRRLHELTGESVFLSVIVGRKATV